MQSETLTGSDDDQIRALGLMLRAWEEGCDSGIAPELMAYAALFTALSDLVGAYGEAHVGHMCDGLRARIESGEFTIRTGPPQ
jgi:hypothetical protein